MSRSKTTAEHFIEAARLSYLDHFKREMQIRKLSEPDTQAEELRRHSEGWVVRDGVLNLPSRADFSGSSSNQDQSRDFKPAATVEFEPVTLQIGKTLKVTMFPFSWDNIQICFETGDDPKRLLRLRLWFLEWLQARQPQNNLKGAVHSLTGPTRIDKEWLVSVDMGTAPVEALTELFRVLASRGVTQVTLGAELNRVPL